MKPISLVTPWFGNTNGGAEVFCAGLARALRACGLDVEVLATCCRDPFHDWGANHLPPGRGEALGVPVQRFPVNRRDADAYARWLGVLESGADLAPEHEEELIANSIHSHALVDHVGEHRDERLFFFLPYLYGTTIRGVGAAGGKSGFLIPCLHNEPFAYMAAMQTVFSRAAGVLFLSEPERDFASALYDISARPRFLLGGGVGRDVAGDAARFRKGRGAGWPFALFAGRKVPGKGADLLVKYFGDYLALHPRENLHLVMLGSGEVAVPADLRGRIHSWGADSPTDLHDAMAACELLIHPSLYESFSIVMMEAWMNNRPVVVNGECEVTLHHVLRSNGGLYFTGFGEFNEVLGRLRGDRVLAAALGGAGRRFVESQYLWPDVAARFLQFLETV